MSVVDVTLVDDLTLAGVAAWSATVAERQVAINYIFSHSLAAAKSKPQKTLFFENDGKER